eukprot:7388411-Prymnesium_polylepis.1
MQRVTSTCGRREATKRPLEHGWPADAQGQHADADQDDADHSEMWPWGARSRTAPATLPSGTMLNNTMDVDARNCSDDDAAHGARAARSHIQHLILLLEHHNSRTRRAEGRRLLAGGSREPKRCMPLSRALGVHARKRARANPARRARAVWSAFLARAQMRGRCHDVRMLPTHTHTNAAGRAARSAQRDELPLPICPCSADPMLVLRCSCLRCTCAPMPLPICPCSDDRDARMIVLRCL